MTEAGKARFITGTHDVSIDGDTVTIHAPGVDLDVPMMAFEAMMTQIPVLPDDHLLSWDCGCATKGLFHAPAGLVYEAIRNKWSLAQVGNQYKQRANSMPELYPTPGHSRYLEGLWYVADEMRKLGAIEVNPFG